MTQNQLDALLGMARGTVAQIENGTMLPPDNALCARIDAALELPPGTMWRETAPYRLRRFDQSLADWHEAQVEAATDLNLTEGEREAVLRCRAIEQRRGISSLLQALVNAAAAADADGLTPEGVRLSILDEGRRAWESSVFGGFFRDLLQIDALGKARAATWSKSIEETLLRGAFAVLHAHLRVSEAVTNPNPLEAGARRARREPVKRVRLERTEGDADGTP